MLFERIARVHSITAGRKSAPVQTIPFGGFMPDRPDLANPGSVEALNVIPHTDGFRPFPGPTEQSDALTARCQGAGSAVDSSGDVHVYAGDATKLYAIANQAQSDKSKSGGYSTPADGGWQFAQFGRNYLLATNYADAVQSIAPGGAIFADHFTSTEKPKAKYITVTRDFVVLGNIESTADGTVPERVQWSGINDSLDMDPALASQSDFQDIPEGGHVRQVVGHVEYFLAFMDNAINRFTYVGPDEIFQRDVIDEKRGTPFPNSVINHGRRVYFLSEEGFMMTEGIEATPIGDNQIDRYVLNQLDVSNFSRVSASIDPFNNVCIWLFPGTGSSAGTPNMMVLFNWLSGRWARVELDLDLIMRSSTPGYTLEELDSINSSLDALPYSLDSKAWQGGAQKFAGFNTDKKLVFFDGDNLQATIDTQDFVLEQGRRSKLRNSMVLVDGGSPTVAASGRSRLKDTVSYGTAASQTTLGFNPFRSEGLFHRLRTIIPAADSWDYAQGIQIWGSSTGRK